MIVDALKNSHLYDGLNERFKKAFDFLKYGKIEDLAIGRYDIMSDEIFALVQEYKTKDIEDCLIEGHKKYADIQYVFRGKEKIGYLKYDNQIPVKEYNEESDCWMFNESVDCVKLDEDSFAICFPDDLHMPRISCSEHEFVKKVVVKVLL